MFAGVFPPESYFEEAELVLGTEHIERRQGWQEKDRESQQHRGKHIGSVILISYGKFQML